MTATAILGMGMFTSVGSRSNTACGAMRAGLRRFRETRFLDRWGRPLIGAAVPLSGKLRGLDRLIELVLPALRECLAHAMGTPAGEIALFLAVAEEDRPGRPRHLDSILLPVAERRLGVRFHARSKLVPGGRAAGARAFDRARASLGVDGITRCIVAGVDSLLHGPTLAGYEAKERLKTSYRSNGFIPGEAGAALLLGPASQAPPDAPRCIGVGFGRETATILSGAPLRADGLAAACRGALAEAGLGMGDMDFRIADASGEEYGFRETSLTVQRLLRTTKVSFDLWLPAEQLGEVGAAVVPCAIGRAVAAWSRGYAPGERALCHFSSDDGDRAAVILQHRKGAA